MIVICPKGESLFDLFGGGVSVVFCPRVQGSEKCRQPLRIISGTALT